MHAQPYIMLGIADAGGCSRATTPAWSLAEYQSGVRLKYQVY